MTFPSATLHLYSRLVREYIRDLTPSAPFLSNGSETSVGNGLVGMLTRVPFDPSTEDYQAFSYVHLYLVSSPSIPVCAVEGWTLSLRSALSRI